MTDETKTIDVLIGPYRGSRLTVSAADADAAVNGHWATDPNAVSEPDHEPHPPLSDEERTEALTAATTWAKLQWDTAQQAPPPDPQPDPPTDEDGNPITRDMQGDEPGRYTTRSTKPRRS